MKTIGVLTSGGDAPGMNAAIRSVVRTSIYQNARIFGIKQGYNGLINGEIEEMNLSSVADIIHRGGTMLRSARSDEFTTKAGFNKALNVVRVFGIEGLIILGGDGTFRGAKKLHDAGIPTICIPCTIDNDMGYTDYTIGFFTAVETVVDAISKIRDTSTSHGRANIIEVMGRECGDIALYSGLAGGAESIIVPEVEFDIDEVCRKIIHGRNRGKLHHIIVLAEGIGNAYEVGREIEEKTGAETKVTILGHIQRGGTPTAYDRIIASKMGNKAVELLLAGESGKALGIKCNQLISMDIDEALNVKKEFDKGMYDIGRILSI
ncbi:6-phosphofructokinase [Tepidimicrobium xylanilyticum]|uniref:ATP-dependent 6-phosphofructokinase n=1 Tax=Tepidimicrobium xylanilyticum TaxID=1123352 RepID=A0A1H2UU49_9FIRM|nr:6-phosphofructokinase [Tepidimicrobium xylanilyticum]GMG96808.1 ATP-dependent 6-phosphofructokinase [Tepidimicrobium xylanilyticum]SDW59653.1 6-phosphofructokinase [Tepidimicrobium xylanilyticum]